METKINTEEIYDKLSDFLTKAEKFIRYNWKTVVVVVVVLAFLVFIIDKAIHLIMLYGKYENTGRVPRAATRAQREYAMFSGNVEMITDDEYDRRTAFQPAPKRASSHNEKNEPWNAVAANNNVISIGIEVDDEMYEDEFLPAEEQQNSRSKTDASAVSTAPPIDYEEEMREEMVKHQKEKQNGDSGDKNEFGNKDTSAENNGEKDLQEGNRLSDVYCKDDKYSDTVKNKPHKESSNKKNGKKNNAGKSEQSKKENVGISVIKDKFKSFKGKTEKDNTKILPNGVTALEDDFDFDALAMSAADEFFEESNQTSEPAKQSVAEKQSAETGKNANTETAFTEKSAENETEVRYGETTETITDDEYDNVEEYRDDTVSAENIAASNEPVFSNTGGWDISAYLDSMHKEAEEEALALQKEKKQQQEKKDEEESVEPETEDGGYAGGLVGINIEEFDM